MGLISLFDSKANLSSIFNPEKHVYVKDVMHKVTIEVNEKGSRASAVTGTFLWFLSIFVFILMIINE